MHGPVALLPIAIASPFMLGDGTVVGMVAEVAVRERAFVCRQRTLLPGSS